MDQYPFKFEFHILGLDVEDFINALDECGYDKQANIVRFQFKNQLDNI